MDWARHKTTWPNAVYSRFVETRAHRWHVQRAGEGPGVLLLHGAGGALHSWRGMFGSLAAQAEVYALDLPGHGFTQRRAQSRTRLPDMAEDVHALLNQEGFVPQLVIGHSAGAAIALQMTKVGPAPAHIMGINPALVPFQGLAGLLFPPLAKLLALNPFAAPFFARTAASETAVRNLISSTGSQLDPEGMALYRALIGDAAHVDGALRMMARWNLNPLLAELSDIDTPITLMVGENDKTVPPETTRNQASRLPNARLVEVPILGHLMHEEDPAHFASVAIQILHTDPV
ncbi:MAG: alpha/beta fold hydrolase BchO [Pseudomonadota bacterium]